MTTPLAPAADLHVVTDGALFVVATQPGDLAWLVCERIDGQLVIRGRFGLQRHARERRAALARGERVEG